MQYPIYQYIDLASLSDNLAWPTQVETLGAATIDLEEGTDYEVIDNDVVVEEA